MHCAGAPIGPVQQRGSVTSLLHGSYTQGRRIQPSARHNDSTSAGTFGSGGLMGPERGGSGA